MHRIIDLKLWWKEIDKINFVFISILLIVGVILSFSLNQNLLIFNKHLIFSIIAFITMIYLSSLEPKKLRRISLFFFIFFILLLFLLLFLDY